MISPLKNWQDLINATRSTFFKGHTQDTVFDRSTYTTFSPSTEALFTQSNARVLLGHAANGILRMTALPTQVYAAPTQTSEFGLGPGMYHHFDAVMFGGNLTYKIMIDDERNIDVGADDRENETCYANHFIPLTTTHDGELEIATVSFAPVAPDPSRTPLAPAPLPGPAGVIYVLVIKNSSHQPCKGKVQLVADDLLLGHYEDAAPERYAINQPERHLRQNTLILNSQDGAVGIHLHDGQWRHLEPPFSAICDFTLSPGEEIAIETHIAMGATFSEIMPVIFALHMRSALEWLNLTIGYWASRLGALDVDVAHSDAGEFTRDIYIRSLFDNFNCLQTDADGNLISHWQGAPSHGYGTVWGIDVEPTAVSVVNLCPEIARQAMLFFLNRSHVPKGPPDHSVPILIAPIIIARQWLQTTGDIEFLEKNPEIVSSLVRIMDDVMALKAPAETLFPTRYSSDGAVGRRYDYGANVKVYYAFESLSYILEMLGRRNEAESYLTVAKEIQQAISRHMTADGPFGLQITGGTNLGENVGGFYLSEDMLYYDGEDTSSMLAPIYGVCEPRDQAWSNYHRFARSLWCASYDMEFDALLWYPAEPAILDGTAFFSRLGGSVTQQEMLESLEVLREIAVDDVTGSVFWWPHGLEYKRALTRCSQGQGAWAWQYLEQWLGLMVDAESKTLVFSPRGLLTKITWEGFRSGQHHFDLFWEEDINGTVARVTNKNKVSWNVKTGFRPFGSGAESCLYWQSRQVKPGETIELTHQTEVFPPKAGISQKEMIALQVKTMGENGYLFKRFGPAQQWGHWDNNKLWDMQAMPLALRFAILNDSGEDWISVRVNLQCPEGWSAQGRRPLHWDKADQLLPGKVTLELGSVPTGSKTVAPFWISAPKSLMIDMVWWNASIAPFHQPSQPEAGIKLYTRNPKSRKTDTFGAELVAETASGEKIQKMIDIPVEIELK